MACKSEVVGMIDEDSKMRDMSRAAYSTWQVVAESANRGVINGRDVPWAAAGRLRGSQRSDRLHKIQDTAQSVNARHG